VTLRTLKITVPPGTAGTVCWSPQQNFDVRRIVPVNDGGDLADLRANLTNVAVGTAKLAVFCCEHTAMPLRLLADVDFRLRLGAATMLDINFVTRDRPASIHFDIEGEPV